jgi:hypothetical protein
MRLLPTIPIGLLTALALGGCAVERRDFSGIPGVTLPALAAALDPALVGASVASAESVEMDANEHVEEPVVGWPFRAVRLRMHPLTHAVLERQQEHRLPESRRGTGVPPVHGPDARATLTHHAPSPSDETAVIEARVEFFDQFGHTTKGMGLVRFELFPARPGGSRLEGAESLGVWGFDLNDLDTNLTHYDEVTRTYRFRLRLDPSVTRPEQGRLVIGARTPDGRRLTGEYALGLR